MTTEWTKEETMYVVYLLPKGLAARPVGNKSAADISEHLGRKPWYGALASSPESAIIKAQEAGFNPCGDRLT